jgi:hypothetical protein
MSFLTRSAGMGVKEAREILALHELIAASLQDGPVPLGTFARIVGSCTHLETSSCSCKPSSWERRARRLKASLTTLGFRITVDGDAEKITMDFARDEALRAEVERWVDRAAKRLHPEACGEGEGDEENDSVQLVERAPLDSIKFDHALGMSIRALARRYGITERRIQSLLRALRVEARDEGRPPIEKRRSLVVVEQCFHLGEFRVADGRRGSERYGRVQRVAEILGCHRNTARQFLKRYDELRERKSS